MRDADATDAAPVRYQIKRRRLTTHNNSRQLGALRDLSAQGFDVLAAVLFQEDYRVLKAALIPHARIGDLAKRVERTNSWRFLLRDAIWSVPDVRDATHDLRKAEAAWAEVLVRSRQRCEPAWVRRPPAPSFEIVDHHAGFVACVSRTVHSSASVLPAPGILDGRHITMFFRSQASSCSRG